MRSDEHSEWVELVLRVLTVPSTKIDLSLGEERNVIRLSSEEVGEVKLVLASSNGVKIFVEEVCRADKTRAEVLSDIAEEVEGRGLVDSEIVDRLVGEDENFFGAIVKLAVLLKEEHRRQATGSIVAESSILN